MVNQPLFLVSFIIDLGTAYVHCQQKCLIKYVLTAKELLVSCSQYVTKLLGGSEAPSNP